jgi:hypothetical protein
MPDPLVNDLFKSARLKIERADHHISDLERQLSALTRQNLDASIRQRDDGELDITLTVIPPPPCIALTIGDAVHNLWSALDHLAWEVVGLDDGCQHPQLYFPKGRDGPSYKGLCYGMKAVSPEVKQLFESLEAFPDGRGHFLYVTHRLDNADKHTVLTPVVNAPNIKELVLVSDQGNVRSRLSDLYGSDVTLHHGETFTVDGAPIGARLAFNDEAQISPHILFGNIEFVQGEPIFPTILKLRRAVADAVDSVARARQRA